MHSTDKPGRLKKQIDRYFLPVEINPNVILDIIRMEDRKNLSPAKIKQETLSKFSQEAQKFELLRVTGRELNSNFTQFNNKVTKDKTSSKASPKKEVYKYKIQQLLSQPLESIVETISQDPDSHLYARELEELHRFKSVHQSSNELRLGEILEGVEASRDDRGRERFQNIIMSNPTLYKKMLLAYHKLESQKINKIPSVGKREKRASLSEAIISKRMVQGLKKGNAGIEKQLPPHQQKRLNNYIQYRQFLLLINLSNKIIIFPENDVQYKGYICKGNNGLLVKSIIKSRPWWALRSNSDLENCNLVWTEWKKTKLTNSLPFKEFKPDKASFYATNYYERINQADSLEEGEGSQNREAAKIENQGKAWQILQNKLTQINRIVNSQKILPLKYINKQQAESSYYTFTRKINQKKFEQLAKRFLPGQPIYNSQPNKQKSPVMIVNHVPGCYQLHSKKLLFLNMRKYYERNGKEVFQYLPETYLVKDGIQDANFSKFVARFQMLEQEKNDPTQKNKFKNVWICKPGQNSNRGNGITVVSTIDEVRSLIKSMNSHNRTLIIQKYMQNPYLYNRRKFDIRCYLLITTVNGIIKGYFFNEGYIRTTSKEYNLKNLDNKFIHLTNDAIQKKGDEYGKFQGFNKVSFGEFEKYLEAGDKEEVDKFVAAKGKIKEIVVQVVKAVANKLNPARKQFCFEVFGLDFMLDAKMKPYLIEANSNPCLQVDGSVLSKVIPTMVQHTIRIAIDPLYPPPYSQNWKTSRFSPGNPFQQNKYELVYDSLDDPNLKDNVLGMDEMKEMQEEEEECQGDLENQFQ